MALHLKEAKKANKFIQGTYFQSELEDTLTQIWNNQNHLTNEDLDNLKKFT